MTEKTPSWKNWNRETFARAEEEDRLLFVLVTAFRSPSCEEVKARIERSATFARWVSRAYLPVLLDVDEYPEAERALGFPPIPSAAVLRGDGAGLALLEDLSPKALDRRLGSLLPGGSSSEGAPRERESLEPWEEESLERAMESVEQLARDLLSALDSMEGMAGVSPGNTLLNPMRFLVTYSIQASDRSLLSRAREVLRALALSPLYDKMEGGFFEETRGGEADTAKCLGTNARWLSLVLEAATPPAPSFAEPLAKGLLHYLQRNLLGEDGTFANGRRADPAYYALSAEERGAVDPPPLDPRRFTAPNAECVRAVCLAWRHFMDPSLLDLAERCYSTLKRGVLDEDGAVAHGFTGGRRRGTLSDLLAVGRAALALYHSTLREEYLGDLALLVREGLAPFRNLGGEGFLEGPSPSDPAFPPPGPAVHGTLNAEAALLLLAASVHLEDESLAETARRSLGDSLRCLHGADTLADRCVVGLGLMGVLLPPVVYTAVTDGSEEHRGRILSRMRGRWGGFVLLRERRPSRQERMQPLPRLTARCGNQVREITGG